MSRGNESPGERLLKIWNRLSALPAGKWLFARLLGRMVPYTGTIHPRVEELRPGYARVSIRDSRSVRNHLASIHAIALLNLGEVTSGLAVTTALPANVRGIVTALRAEYLKKARGTLVAEANEHPQNIRGQMSHDARAEVRDSEGDVVARVTATWLLERR